MTAPDDAYARPAPYGSDYPTGYAQAQPPATYQQAASRYQQQAQPLAPSHRHSVRGGGLRLTAAEAFWYVLGNIALGAMYFAKVPVKKAFEEAGLAQMTAMEKFWYVLMCVAFGGGYFAKLPVKKALAEASAMRPEPLAMR